MLTELNLERFESRLGSIEGTFTIVKYGWDKAHDQLPG